MTDDQQPPPRNAVSHPYVSAAGAAPTFHDVSTNWNRIISSNNRNINNSAADNGAFVLDPALLPFHSSLFLHSGAPPTTAVTPPPAPTAHRDQFYVSYSSSTWSPPLSIAARLHPPAQLYSSLNIRDCPPPIDVRKPREVDRISSPAVVHQIAAAPVINHHHQEADASDHERGRTEAEERAIRMKAAAGGFVVTGPPPPYAAAGMANGNWLKVEAADPMLLMADAHAKNVNAAAISSTLSSSPERTSFPNQDLQLRRSIMQNAELQLQLQQLLPPHQPSAPTLHDHLALHTSSSLPGSISTCYNATPVCVDFSTGARNAMLRTAPAASVNQCYTSAANAFTGDEQFINAYDCCMPSGTVLRSNANSYVPTAAEADHNNDNPTLPQQKRLQRQLDPMQRHAAHEYVDEMITEQGAAEVDLVNIFHHQSSRLLAPLLESRNLILPTNSSASNADDDSHCNFMQALVGMDDPKYFSIHIDEELERCLFGSYGSGIGGAYLACDEFRMYEFKVRGCMREKNHDWTECPFAHPGEKARRRDPLLYQYSATPCPDFRKSSSCKRGDDCDLSHGVFECWLHPSRYRTQLCKDGKQCIRNVCFFAHSPSQLRVLWSSPPSCTTASSAAADHSHIIESAVDSPRSCCKSHDPAVGSTTVLDDGKLRHARLLEHVMISTNNLYDGSPMRLAIADSQRMEGLPSYYHHLFLGRYHDQSTGQLRRNQLIRGRGSRRDSLCTFDANRKSAGVPQGVNFSPLVDRLPGACRCEHHPVASPAGGRLINHQNFHQQGQLPQLHQSKDIDRELQQNYLSANVSSRAVRQVIGYDDDFFLNVGHSTPSGSRSGFPHALQATIASSCEGIRNTAASPEKGYSQTDHDFPFDSLQQRYTDTSYSPGNCNIFQQLPPTLSSSRSLTTSEGFLPRMKASDLRTISNGINTYRNGAFPSSVNPDHQYYPDTTSGDNFSNLVQSSCSSDYLGMSANVPKSDVGSATPSLANVLQSQSIAAASQFGASQQLSITPNYSGHGNTSAPVGGLGNPTQRHDFASPIDHHSPSISPMAIRRQPAAHPQLLGHLVSSLHQMERRTMEIENRGNHPSRPNHGEAMTNENGRQEDRISRSTPSDSSSNTNELGEKTSAVTFGGQKGIQFGEGRQQPGTKMSNDRMGYLDFGWVNELVK